MKKVKKSIFLNTVINECNFEVKIYNDKVENLRVSNIKTLISRAFAPLKKPSFKSKALYLSRQFWCYMRKTYMEELLNENFFALIMNVTIV